MHCYGASMPLTAYALLHLRRALPRTWVLSAAPHRSHQWSSSGYRYSPPPRCVGPAFTGGTALSESCSCHSIYRELGQQCFVLTPYHRRNSIAGSPPTVPEKALGWFPRKATVGSKRQREYLREMGYKVNRDDDNGDGATKQDALPLTPPVFGRLRRK